MSAFMLKNKGEGSKLADDIRDAIGAGPDEPVQCATPQFTRTSDMTTPGAPPTDFEELRQMSKSALKELGLQPWNDPFDQEPRDEERFGKQVLMLFPGEWFRHIPEGFKIVDIFGKRERFHKRSTDNDIRFGCLAFGVLVEP